MGTISKNFSYQEFEVTDNKRFKEENIIKDFEVRDNIKSLVLNILQPLRDSYGKPLAINSGYRCDKLNNMLGGAKNSQHLYGMAADICPFSRNRICSNEEILGIANLVLYLGLDFDQMGIYNNFIHLSYNKEGNNRGQIFYGNKYSGKKI